MQNKPGNLFSLEGRTALITGATQGIGFVLAEGLASCGAKVIINGRDKTKVEAAVSRHSEKFPEIYGIVFDVTKPADIEAAADDIEKEHGHIDILVNNAGIQRRYPLEDFPLDEWTEVINTNLNAIQYVTRYFVKGMISRKSGKIINICSLMSELGRYSIGAYTAAKGGVKMLTRAMATEWAKHNIQVNGIGPGYFKTEMNRKLYEDEQFSNWICRRTPSGRWGEPGELAGVAIFLASEASAFVNGQIIYVDGGILASL